MENSLSYQYIRDKPSAKNPNVKKVKGQGNSHQMQAVCNACSNWQAWRACRYDCL